MKLKQKILALGAGIGLALPSLSVFASGSCQRCEEAWETCHVIGQNTWQYCYALLNCFPC